MQIQPEPTTIHIPRTLRDFMRLDEVRHIDVRLGDWFSGGYNYHGLFYLFGKNIFLDDLNDERCLLRIKQNTPTASMKLHYYHPRFKMSFVFKIPANRLPSGYMDMCVRQLVAWLTLPEYYTGAWPASTEEVMTIFGAYEHDIIDSYSNEQLLDIVNKRMLDELGDAAWKPKPATPTHTAEIIDFKSMVENMKASG